MEAVFPSYEISPAAEWAGTARSLLLNSKWLHRLRLALNPELNATPPIATAASFLHRRLSHMPLPARQNHLDLDDEEANRLQARAIEIQKAGEAARLQQDEVEARAKLALLRPILAKLELTKRRSPKVQMLRGKVDELKTRLADTRSRLNVAKEEIKRAANQAFARQTQAAPPPAPAGSRRRNPLLEPALAG